MYSACRNASEISSELNINLLKVKNTLSARDSIIKCRSPTIDSRHIELTGKLKAILRSESCELHNNICKEFHVAHAGTDGYLMSNFSYVNKS